MPSSGYYVGLARGAALQLLEDLDVLVPGEIFARVSDRKFGKLTIAVNPHHVRTALRELRDDGATEETLHVTKGGHEVALLHLRDLKGRAQAVKEASGRKATLYGRFLGWSQATARYPRGLIGPAGESVLHKVLRDAAPDVGLRLINPSGGEVHVMFDEDVPDGPLDSGALLPTFDSGGNITAGVWLLIEVKNVRQWIYRDDYRLFQLLHKAALLQQRFPDKHFLPVLICRRVQRKTFEMAKKFGFFVGDTRAQFIRSVTEVTPKKLFEVQSEVGFYDVVFETDVREHRLLRSYFVKAIPRIAQEFSETWAEVGSALGNVYDALRDPDLPLHEREAWMKDIYEIVNPREQDDDDGLFPTDE